MSHEISRRELLQGAVLLGTGVLSVRPLGGPEAADASAVPAEIVAKRPFLPYAPGSFFKSRVIGAPVAAQRTQEFHAFMRTFRQQRRRSYPKLNGIGASMWGTAFCFGRVGHPIWRLTGRVPPKCSILTTQGFHAPLWITNQISGTNDSPMCVVDLVHGYTVFAANVVPNLANHTFNVLSAGITYHSSNGLDHRNPRSDDMRNFTVRGRISDAMVVRRDLVDYGVKHGTSLGHVLHMFMVETRGKDGFCNPMVGCEKNKTYGFGAEGERIALRPGIDLRARGLTGAALVVARTLQEYGAYIGDNSGSESSIHCAQSSATYDPWKGTNLTHTCLAGKISWDDFFVLPRGWQ